MQAGGYFQLVISVLLICNSSKKKKRLSYTSASEGCSMLERQQKEAFNALNETQTSLQVSVEYTRTDKRRQYAEEL